MPLKVVGVFTSRRSLLKTFDNATQGEDDVDVRMFVCLNVGLEYLRERRVTVGWGNRVSD